jgi:hypothetical protein
MDLPKKLGLDGQVPRNDLVIHLIKAELKSRKFTRALEEVGFDTTFYSLDFSSLILDIVGFEMRSDETFELYHHLLETFVQKMDLKSEEEDLNKIAKDFYQQLSSAKKKN